MTTTPVLGITELAAAQAVPEVSVNQGTRYLEQGAGWFRFKDRGLAAQPGSPADGDCYLLPASATGAEWAGHDGEIAFYLSTAWAFIAPAEGMAGYVSDEDVAITYDGAAWNTLGGGGGVTYASAAEIRTGTETSKAVAPDQLVAAHVPVALTDAAPTTWNMDNGFNRTWTLGANRTLSTPTNPKAGMTYVLEVIQDGTGSRTVTWPASFNWGSAGAPTLSTGANKVDLVTLYCRDAATPKFRAVFNKDA